jgi:hypothetical protein
MGKRVRILVIVAAATAVVAAAVIGGRVLAGTATVGRTTGGGTPSASAAPGDGPATVTATDADNDHSVNLAVGDRLVVALASTYWHFTALDTTGILAGQGPGVVAATAPGHGCVPGAGCGTVTIRYAAVAAGQVTVAADRTICGEAMRCTGTSGTYRLHVVVR